MWRASSNPEFVLQGHFQEVVLYCLKRLLGDILQADRETLTAIFEDRLPDPEDLFFIEWHEPFETLPAADKVVLLARVIRALTDETEPAPELFQYNESAVYAIFEGLYVLIGFEIDDTNLARECGEDPYNLRRRVSLVEKEWLQYSPPIDVADDEKDAYIDYTSDDLEDWENVVDALAELILWDTDFVEGPLADSPPDVATEAKKVLGIAEDYYSKAMPPATAEEFYSAVAYLNQLCNQDDE